MIRQTPPARSFKDREAEMKLNEKVIRARGFRLARLRFVLLLSGVAGFSGCADPIAPAIRSCPCAAGNVCCESGVCAANQASCAQATRALSESVAGVWTGYIENFQAINSDDSIKISMSVDASGMLSGQVTIGQQSPPAPATDPSIPWPPSLQNVDPTRDSSSAYIPPTYVAGFAYSARSIAWESQRLKFMIPKHEPWQPWCGLQTSFMVDNEHFSCAPAGGDILFKTVTDESGTIILGLDGGPVRDAQGNCMAATTPPTPVNCEIAQVLCSPVAGCVCTSTGCNCGGLGVCECDASGCKAGAQWMSVPIGYWLDIALLNGRGDGSINLSAGGTELYNVRLTQTSH
jgi:hypothetical protein